VVLWYARNDINNPLFDMSVPRFFLVYIAMAFAVASLSYGLYEFFKFFLVEDKIILSACNKIKK
jgi:hypothetical protein